MDFSRRKNEFGWIAVEPNQYRSSKFYGPTEKDLILTPGEIIAIKYMGGEHDGQIITSFAGLTT